MKGPIEPADKLRAAADRLDDMDDDDGCRCVKCSVAALLRAVADAHGVAVVGAEGCHCDPASAFRDLRCIAALAVADTILGVPDDE